MHAESLAITQSSRFHTTRWTMVVAARDANEPGGQEALGLLCREYCYPLYAFVRRSGRSAEDARDLTQAFFERLLSKGYLLRANPEKGRFRTFLLMALKRFLANEWHRSHAMKRGGSIVLFSIDAGKAEDRYAAEPEDNVSPDMLYDRGWACTLLDCAMERLRREYVAGGRKLQFELLKGFLIEAEESSYADLAGELCLSRGAARVTVHRFRRRFRELIRMELAETVTPDQFDEELRHLREILSA